MLAGPGRRGTAEAGASAVEFALVLPVLMLILLGVIQYGYGLFQLQNFSSIVNDASKRAGTGISDCASFRTQVRTLASNGGIDPASITTINVTWLTQDPVSHVFSTASSPTRLGLARVTATFRPFQLGAPLVPFPATITRTQTSPVQDVGAFTGVC